MSVLTLLDVVKRNNSDAAVGLINECAQAHPEVFHGAARTIKGINFYTLVATGIPTGSSFRAMNEGVSYNTATRENRLVECYIFNKRWSADKAVADASEDGAAALMAEEAELQLEAGFQDMASQFYYGVTADAKGFVGLVASVDSTMEVNAGGTTASTGSSVWAVRWGRKDVEWVLGQGGAFEPSDVRIESITNSSGNAYTAYIQEILARPGLQIGSKYSIGRIKKITEDSGKTLTDALISDLLGKFPSGKAPNALYMTRRSIVQLQKSRTATTPTGAAAPFPTHVQGLDGQMIPIYVTDAITNTESVA